MIRAVAIVAQNTFREAVRDRVLYNLVFFALLMMAAAILVGQISIGIQSLVIVSLGLSAISLIGLLMAIFIGVGLVYKEIDKRTLYALLSKPIRRGEFLVGKFAGLVLTLTLNTALMTLGLAAALFFVNRTFASSDRYILVAVYFILLKLGLVTALALLFSCFSTPLLSILFTVGIYISGLFANEIRSFSSITGNHAVDAAAVGLSYLLPNFNNFNVIASAAHGRAISGSLILHNSAYAAIYIAIVLLVAVATFSRRDLK